MRPPEIVQVTPQLAAYWLTLNKKNRPIRSITHRFARDMLAGQWLYTGEAIKFNDKGEMIDGQHRCAAVVESGVTVPMLVVWDLDSRSQEVMDTGAKRSLGDALALRGEVRTHNLAATLRRILQLRSSSFRKNGSFSNSECFSLLESEPHIRDSVRIGGNTSGAFVGITPATAGTVFHEIVTKFPDLYEEAVYFFEGLGNGVDLPYSSPVLALRDTLIRQGKKKEYVGETTVTIRAWNFYIKGEPKKALYWPGPGTTLPTIQGK